MKAFGLLLFLSLLAMTNVAIERASAQHGRDVPPAGQVAPQPGANPTAKGVTEEQLFEEMRRLEGRVSIPDSRAATLIQPQGRTYQAFRERYLPWIGGIVIIGMLAALLAFYLWRGPITLEGVRVTGAKILRFTWFERFNHWLTAVSFIVLAITGLNYVFGKRLLFPLIGPDAFATWSQWAKFLHNAFAWPFMLGLIIMIGIWIRDNLPDRYDMRWLREFGGFVSGKHPPARRFNAGQKLIFWAVTIGGIALSVSGIVLLFPFTGTDINAMQIAQYAHALVGMGLIAVILAHIYIGTIGMQGASDAMLSGEVDAAWARAHHSVWVEEEGAAIPGAPPPRSVPAE